MPPEPTGARFLSGTRWACRGCGACCHGFSFGPVEPEIIAGLQQADIAALWPAAAQGPWFEQKADGLYLAERDQHCVFLDDDNRCAVHRLLGAAAKPAFCREYPFHVVDDAAGTAVIVRADCGGLHESFLDGDPVDDQVADVLALPQARPRRRFAPDAVVLLPGAAIDAGAWLRLEPHLLRLVPREPPEAAVAAVRAVLYDVANRPAPTPDPARYALALRACLHALSAVLEPARLGPAGYRTDLVASVADTVARAAAAPALPGLTPEAIDYLHLVLRTELLGKEFASVGGVPFGLGLYLLATSVARLGSAGDPQDPGAIGPAVAAFKRVSTLPVTRDVLLRARPALADLFLHAPPAG